MEKITFEFLWNGKDRIKRNVMCQDYKNGGVRMTNYRVYVKAQRIIWRDVYYGNQDMGWKRFFDYIAVDQWVEDLKKNVIMKYLKLEIPKFYMEILEAWEDIRECRNVGN